MTMTVERAIQDYLAKTNLAPSTRAKYDRILRRWLEALAEEEDWQITADTPVEELTIHDAEPFMAFVLGLAPVTRRVYASALIGFFEFLELRELAPGVSTARLRQLLAPMVGGRRASLQDYAAAEIEAIVDTASELAAGPFEETPQGQRLRLIMLRDYALVVTLADTGMRISEAVSLRLGDVQWSARPMMRAKVLGKGGKERWAFFSGRASQALRAYLGVREANSGGRNGLPLFANHSRSHSGRPISTTTGWKIVRRLAELALPPDRAIAIHPHTFRHRFLTKIWRTTGDLHLAQLMAGHTNIATTTRYTHASVEDLADGYARVFEIENPMPAEEALETTR